MKVSSFSSGCGAEILGIQLADLSDAELNAIRQAYKNYGLLFFRDQDLSPEDHLQFARRFGDIVVNKFFKATKSHPEIAEVRKEASQETNIGGGWHTDHSYDDEPAMGSILVARELPKTGGDTLFANLTASYEALSAGLKQTLSSLKAVHSNRHLYGEGGYYRQTDLAEQLGGMDSVGDAIHPVVIRHPESGKKVLYINPGHTIKFEGWTSKESMPLLHYLYAHVDQPEFTCRFNWQPGSIAIWDNRSTWHMAENDYQGQFRLMHRITLKGSALSAA